MNGSPTADQDRFHAWCRDRGCILTGQAPDLHHIGGAKMKLKGVHKAGEWYVIPVCSEWHNYYGRPNSIHANKKAFEAFWGKSQKEMWVDLIAEYEEEKGQKPMDEVDYQAIVDRA